MDALKHWDSERVIQAELEGKSSHIEITHEQFTVDMIAMRDNADTVDCG